MRIKNKSSKRGKGNVIRFRTHYVRVDDDGNPMDHKPKFDKKALKAAIENSTAPLSVLADAVRTQRNTINKSNVVSFKTEKRKRVESDNFYYSMHCKHVAGKVKPVGGEAKCLEDYYRRLKETHKHKPKPKVSNNNPNKTRAEMHRDEVKVVYTTPTQQHTVRSKGYSFNYVKSAANDDKVVYTTTAKEVKEVEDYAQWLANNVPISEIPEWCMQMLYVTPYGTVKVDKKAVRAYVNQREKLRDLVLGVAEDYVYEAEGRSEELSRELDEHVTNELKLYNEIEALKDEIGYLKDEIKLLEWEVAARGEPSEAAKNLSSQFIELLGEKDKTISELRASIPPDKDQKEADNKELEALRARVINQRKEIDLLLKEKNRLAKNQWMDRAEVIRLNGEKEALQKALRGVSAKLKEHSAKSSPPLSTKALDEVDEFVSYALLHTPIEVYAKYVLKNPEYGNKLTEWKNNLHKEKMFYRRMANKPKAKVRNTYKRGYSDRAVALANKWSKSCGCSYNDKNLLNAAQVVSECSSLKRMRKYTPMGSINYQRLINKTVGVRDLCYSNPRLVVDSRWDPQYYSKQAAKYYVPMTPGGIRAKKIISTVNKIVDVLNTELNPFERKRQKERQKLEAWAKKEARRQAREAHKQRIKAEQDKKFRENVRKLQVYI